MTTLQRKSVPAKRPALTREQARKVRELMLDSGYSRREAVAWVTEMEPDDASKRPTVRAKTMTIAEEFKVAPLSDLRGSIGRELDEIAGRMP